MSVVPDRRGLLELVEDRGAGLIDHPGGTLLAHLLRTEDLLAAWGASPALRLAGLGHACYGTAGFAPTLLDVATERPLLRTVAGEEAERIIHLYAACDRQRTNPQLGVVDRPTFHDRFDGTTSQPPPEQVAEYAELTFANELDLLRVNEALAARFDGGPLFARWEPLVSAAAFSSFRRVTGWAD